MFNLVEKRRLFSLISGAVIIPGLIIMIYSTITTGTPFRLSIDFVGGSIYELKFTEDGATESNIRDVFAGFGDENVVIQRLGDPSEYRWSVRGAFHSSDEQNEIIDALNGI